MKKRFKLYKSGKLWCCAAIAFVGLTIGGGMTASADADTTDAANGRQVVQTVQTTTFANVNDDQSNATVIADSKISTQSTNQVSQQPVTNKVPTDTTTQNNDANADQGSLDSYQVNTDQKTGQSTLHASGWQATGQSNNEPYRYAILYDNTTKQEVNRQRVTPVTRTDVQRAYSNVDNSVNSGFNVNFTLPNKLSGHSVSVVARYSNDMVNGEGQHTDYWFSPIIIDGSNRASLDGLYSDEKGNIHVSGWHASNVAAGKKYHYIITYDQTQNREIIRQLVKQVQRTDVAQAYPTIGDAAYSGFDASFKLTNQYAQDNIQFISRWTDDPAGNGNSVDYWFPAVNKQNRGNLDSWNLSDAGTLHVAGWHADDASIYEPYHYLIVFDNTTGRQVASVATDTTSSNDVAKVYGDTRSANHARFSYDFKNLDLQPDHSYSLVSRYSSSASGNGNDGVKTDYWFPAENLNQHAFSIDSFSTNGHQLTVRGWMANDEALNKPNAYIILYAGNEIARQKVTLTARPDVANVYPGMYASDQSGFTVTFDIPDNLTTDFNFVLRFSDADNGEGNHADMWTGAYTVNAANFDSISTNGRTLNISGWHAAESALNKKYSYVFAMDALTGKEVTRWDVTNSSNISRGDVQAAYPWMWDSGQSGFTLSADVPDQMTNREIRFMHRYTDDPAGNGDAVDYYDNGIYFFDPDSHSMAVNQFETILDPYNTRNSLYSVYFGDNGQLVRGSRNINGHWYNIDGNTGKVYSFAQRVIDWFRGRRHHLTYSMYGSRNGRDGTADCSGSMTQALRDAGAAPYGFLYSTESLHGYLASNGYYLAGQGTGRMQVQYGDIVIWGRRGYSTGGAGHTVAISSYGSGDRINCISTCGYNHHQPGEAVQEYNYYSYWASDGYPYQYIYRPYNVARG